MSDIPTPDLPPDLNLDPFLQKRPELGGLSPLEAIKAMAASLTEMNAKLAVQPLPNQPGQKTSVTDVVAKIADAIVSVGSKIQIGGGSTFEKEASQMFLDIGKETLKTTILSNRALQRRLGGEVLSAVPHAVVTG